MYETKLQELGLTVGESKVYEALLVLGPSTVGLIVKNAGVAYSNIYDILHRLSEKGLISSITKEKTRYFQAEGLNRIKDYLSQQEQELKTKKIAFEDLSLKLEKLKGFTQKKEEAEVFLGEKALLTAYEKLLQQASQNDEGYFFYVHNKTYYERTERFYAQLWKRIRKYKHSWKGVSHNELKGTKMARTYPSFIQQKYVFFPLPGNIDILGDSILITTWTEKPVGILIHSKETAENYKRYFQEIWKQTRK